MKIQMKLFLETVKKNLIWFIIFILLLGGHFLACNIDYMRPLLMIEEEYLSLIAYPFLLKTTILNTIVFLFQLGLIIYFVYSYYTFEFDVFFQNIVYRVSRIRWFNQKTFILISMSILFKFLYIGIISLLFDKNIVIVIDYFIDPIIFHLSICMVVITFTNLFKMKKIFILVFSLIVCYFNLMFFNRFIVLTLIFLVYIVNCLFMRKWRITE